MAALKEKWEHFLQIIFDPWVLIFLVATLVFVWIAAGQTDQTLIAVLSVLISISSSIVGGVITKNWLDLTEGRVLVARGKSAIRSLKTLLANIADLERRVSQHLSRHTDNSLEVDVVKNSFEEIIGRCNVLEEEAINSIENWTDIIPEAEVKTQIGLISRLREEKTGLENDIKQLRTHVEDVKEKSDAEKEELRKALWEKEKKLSETEAQLLKEQRKVDSGVLSGLPGLTLSSSLGLSSPSYNIFPISALDKICRICGKFYTPPSPLTAFGSLQDDGRCEDCRAKGIV